MKITINDVLFFDVETTGLPEKGQTYDKDYLAFPYIVSMAWSFEGKDSEFIIKPDGWEIPEASTKVHGITTEIAMQQGHLLQDVLHDFYVDAMNAPLICAHNLYFDSSIIKANTLRSIGKYYYDKYSEPALSKEKRIDTMMKTIKFVNAPYPDGRLGKWPKLEELHEKLFPGETFDAHDALEDVLALKRCLPELVKLGIIELKLKEYPTEQTKMEFKSTKTKIKEVTDLGKSAGISSKEAVSQLQKAIDFDESIPNSNFLGSKNSLLDENNF